MWRGVLALAALLAAAQAWHHENDLDFDLDHAHDLDDLDDLDDDLLKMDGVKRIRLPKRAGRSGAGAGGGGGGGEEGDSLWDSADLEQMLRAEAPWHLPGEGGGGGGGEGGDKRSYEDFVRSFSSEAPAPALTHEGEDEDALDDWD